MAQKRANIVYKGTVQGVGFRFTVEHVAKSFGLTGWVRNSPEGAVEVVCEGKEPDIKTFVSRVKKEMGHYISSADIKWETPTGEFDSFNIAFYR